MYTILFEKVRVCTICWKSVDVHNLLVAKQYDILVLEFFAKIVLVNSVAFTLFCMTMTQKLHNFTILSAWGGEFGTKRIISIRANSMPNRKLSYAHFEKSQIVWENFYVYFFFQVDERVTNLVCFL
jgi:hypothetical protein